VQAKIPRNGHAGENPSNGPAPQQGGETSHVPPGEPPRALLRSTIPSQSVYVSERPTFYVVPGLTAIFTYSFARVPVVAPMMTGTW
jgi:hypothetical protein